MENTPSAPTEAPQAPASDKTPTNDEPAQAPQTNPVDLHGFTQDDLAGMRRFIDNNGGWDAIKAKISTPKSMQPVEKSVENSQPQQTNEPTSQPQAQPVEVKLPKGARTQEEIVAQFYFKQLSERPEYAPIAKEIEEGEVLTEMSKLGIPYRLSNGAWDEEKIKDYLDLRAKTVPAKPTNSTPEASAAPTVTYTQAGDNIANIDQAYKIIMEKGNPDSKKAEEYIKNYYSNSGKK